MVLVTEPPCLAGARRWPRASESYQETDIRRQQADTLADSEQSAKPNPEC
jgi:hypothetical protein